MPFLDKREDADLIINGIANFVSIQLYFYNKYSVMRYKNSEFFAYASNQLNTIPDILATLSEKLVIT